jgi:hypothetical protein
VSLDIARVKRRRTVMMGVNVGAAAAALASVVAWFQFGQGWALFAFIGALLVGFGTQIWFIAGLRGPGKGV